MKYSELNDFEINKLVAKNLFPNKKGPYYGDFPKTSYIFVDEHNGLIRRNYCNSWADMGPIIESENICISPVVVQEPDGFSQFKELWEAESMLGTGPFFNSEHKNPLRAAAIC